jgi:predicted alpha-1,2-mannosidase
MSESLTYTVKLPAEKKITLYLTQSLISKEQAEANFEEINFSDAVEKLKSKLEKIFGKYEIEDENPEKLITFYSNLYRMHLYPNRTENGLSVNNGFWDTYRTIWPALFLLEPALSGELLNGFLQHFLDSDSEKGRGWIPRWSAPGPIDSMNGTHSDIVFANAISWDIDGFDWEKAFQASLKNANCESKNPAVGRKGIKDYLEKGYVPNSVPEGLSWTLENSYGDWAILQMAKKLGKSDLVKEFEKRSKNYESVFNKKCGFFIGKDDDGNWSETIENFDPRVWGGDYTETNAYGARFHPVYDQGGLLELYGGEKKLEKALDDFFFIQRETADKKFAGSYGFVIHEQSEAQDVRLGQAGISNQPAHHIPFVYSFCNSKSATRKMQMLVAQICDRLQVGSQIGQGYLGDEDNGEMSAWYFFSNIGLYPLNPVSGDFVIVAPRLKHIKIKLENGVLEIKAPNSSRKNCCVKRVVLNGKKYNGSTINYHDIKNGANIEFELEPFKGRLPI